MNTCYTFEELRDTAESMLMDFEFSARNECLTMLYDSIMNSTKGLQFTENEFGGIASIEVEHVDVGEGQRIVLHCGKEGHTLKIFNNNVEVFSHALSKELVKALHTLATLQARFMLALNSEVGLH